MKLKFALIYVFVTLCGKLQAQTISSSQSGGAWHLPSTWLGGVVPDFSNSTHIIINSAVSIDPIAYPIGTPLSIDQVEIKSGILSVISGAELLIRNGTGTDIVFTDPGQIRVAGKLTMTNGVTLTGNTVSNFLYQSGSEYEHQYISAASLLPNASYDSNSTILISALATGTANSSWSIPLGNVVYDCPGQGNGNVNFAGFLTSIKGNFEIRDTGAGGFVYTNSSSVDLAGGLVISGNLTISGVSHFSPQRMTVGGDIIVTDGTLQDGSIAGTISVGGNLVANGNLLCGKSSFSFVGNSPANITGTKKADIGSLHFLKDIGISSDMIIHNAIVNDDGKNAIASTGTIDFADSAVIMNSGTLSLNHISILPSGTLIAPASELIITGNFSAGSSNAFVHNNGTLLFGGNTEIQGTGNKTFYRLIVASGSHLTGSVNVSVAKEIINHGEIQFTAGNLSMTDGTMNISGTSSNTHFFGVMVNEGTRVTTDSFFSVAGLLSINDSLITNGGFTATASASFSPKGVLISNGNPFRIDGTVTLPTGSVLNTKVDATYTGSLSVAGTLVSSAMTTFGGTTVITGNGTKTFHDVAITGTLTPNSIFTITGNLSLRQTGTLNAGANTIYFDGPDLHIENTGSGSIAFNNASINIGAQLTSNALFTCNNQFLISGTFISNAGFFANDLTVSVDAGVVSANDKPFSVTGTFTVSGGASFVAGAGADAFVYGNISASGELTLRSDLYIPSTTIMTGNGTKSFSNIYITGSFKPNATHSLTGNLMISGNGTLLEGTSTTTFAGPNCVFNNTGSGSSIFNNILINAESKLTSASPLTCNGTFRATGTYDALDDFSVTGTLTVSRNGMFSADMASVLTIGGNLVISGTFDSEAKIIFNGATKITGAGTKNFGTVIVDGSVTAYTGLISLSGDLVNNGNFLHNNGTIAFHGNREKRIASDLPNPPKTIFNNLTLYGGGGAPDLRCDTNIALAGLLSVNTDDAAASFDVDGIENKAVFTLLSTSDNPTIDGSIALLPDNAIVQGDITVQRYLSGEGKIYRYLSTPVEGSGATVASWQKSFPITGGFADPSNPGLVCGRTVLPKNASLFYFREIDKTWVNYPASGNAAANPLEVGKGYAAYIRNCKDSTLLSVSGPLVSGINRGKVQAAISHTDPVITYNNLVGNPYPSAIDWDKVTFSNVSPTIAIRDNASGIFKYYTQGGVGASDIPNGVIAQGQAFWIRSSGPSPQLTMSENSKVASTATAGNIFYREPESNVLEIELSGTTQLEKDHTWILLNQASNNLEIVDPYDAPKMNNQRDDPFEELFDLSTTGYWSGVPLAVNSIPSVPQDSLWLSMGNTKPGEFQFCFRRTGLFADVSIRLLDHFTSKLIYVDSMVSFSVTDDTASQSMHRFQLIFQQEIVLGIAAAYNTINIYPNPFLSVLYIQYPLASVQTKITVEDITGRKIGAVEMLHSDKLAVGQFDFSMFPSGCYFIVATNEKRRQRFRVVKE